MNKYTVGWAFLAIAFAAFEGAALLDPGSGDTLSEHVWAALEAFPLLYVPAIAAFAWAAWHLLWPRRR